MAAPRLTVVGLDAATFDVIDPLLAAGDLPHLGRLFEHGARGVLRSTTHPLTPHAWATMFTGVNAGRHGIWDFIERSESGYELRTINGSYRRAPAIWDRLGRAGKTIGLVNVPFTWPPPQVDGFVLSGFDTAFHENLTYPQRLLGELERKLGRLELDHKYPLGRDGRLDLERVRRSAEQKVELTRMLVDELQPDFLFCVFMSADHAHHLAWTEWEADGARSSVADVYRVLDEAVGGFVEIAGGEDVMVVSDHGGGSLKGVVNLNAWLAEHGFLAYLEPALGSTALRGAVSLRRLLPERARRIVKRVAPELSDRATRPSIEHLVDLSRTRAFAYGAFGNVVLNVRGREEQGIVARGEEYERVRDEIAAGLLELTGPGGERIVRAVHRREDLCDGPELEKVPDLVVEFADYAWLGRGNLRTRARGLWDAIEIEPGSKHAYVGSHRHEGIVALSGPSAARGVSVSASIEDVAPTALYLMGEPVPAGLEGRVIVEALDPDALERRPPEYAEDDEFDLGRPESYAQDEVVEVESRLRGLGYLE